MSPATGVPLLDAHTAGVIACLSEAGIRTGDGERPAGAGWQDAEGVSEFLAYAIVYPLTPRLSGSIARGSDNLTGTWQTTSVSRDRHGAQVVDDKARAALLEGLVVAGRYVWPVRFDGGGEVRRDTSTKGPPLFYAASRFTIRTTPST
jgi:hypothetical protein